MILVNQEPDEDTDVVSAILTFFSLLICLVLFPVSWIFCLTVVSEYERTIVFRLGKVRRGGARGPGIVWTLPCLDTAVLVDLRSQCSPLPLVELQRGSVLIGRELQSFACASNLMP